MFTGLIEATGEVIDLRVGTSLRLRAPKLAGETSLGESVAVNGCCLTITHRDGNELTFDLLGETLARTNLGSLRTGDRVNLERALSTSGRLGGHFVQGHIDCTSRVLAFERVKNDWRLEIEVPPEFARYVIPKGSIAVNGVSLTVASIAETTVVVWIIPHTHAQTNLSSLFRGDLVNVEFDLLAKHVEKLLAAGR